MFNIDSTRARSLGHRRNFASLGLPAFWYADSSAQAARYRRRPPLLLTSREIVEGARSRRRAMARYDYSPPSPREISSRSANDSRSFARVLPRAGIPPTEPSSLWTVFVEHLAADAASAKLLPSLMSRRTSSRSSRVSRTPRIRFSAIATPPPNPYHWILLGLR